MTQEVVEAKAIENTNPFMSNKPNLYIYTPLPESLTINLDEQKQPGIFQPPC